MQPVIDFISKYTTVRADEQLDMINLVQFSTVNKNELLVTQGKLSRVIAFIIKGAARTYYFDTNGDEQTIRFAFENEPIGSLDGFFNQTPSPVNICTLEPTELITVSREGFFEFLEKHPRFEAVLRNMISQYVRVNTEHANLLRITSSRERYEMLAEIQPNVIQRVPLKFVASYLGMSKETLSRVRARKQ